MDSTDLLWNKNKRIWLKSTQITVVSRTTIAGITHETSQAIEALELMGSDVALCELAKERE